MEAENRLIAEFLGWREQTDPTERWFSQWYKPNYGWVKANELCFDCDWNWLMIVVEKIESLSFQTKISLADDATYKFKVSKSESGYDVKGVPTWDDTRIKAVYRGVIEFIKWYNKNK